jgi:Sec-independent protein translocase protein TatA
MGIGITEIILIVVVAYFLFGPEKFPKVIAEFMRTVNSLLKVKDEVLGSVTDIKNDIEGSVANIKNELNTAAAEMKNEITKPLTEIEKSINDTIDPKKMFNPDHKGEARKIENKI